MKVTIVNFQSLANVTLDVEGLTVLIGGSNLGKSAFIRAVEGALYNRGGESFVRKGASRTGVTLEGLPTSSSGFHNIIWEKGSSGLNQFVVDGELYDKVGLNAPQHLPLWGYKDLLIDKEYIRPQVSSQFEGFFLLGRPGSFISDVLTRASRLSVLTTANDRCSVDLRKNKSLQGVRREDLAKSKKRLTDMEPILLMSARVNELGPKISAARELNVSIQEKRSLFTRLQSLTPVLELKLPERVQTPTTLGEKEAEIRSLLTNRKKLSNLPSIPDQPINIPSALQKADEWRQRLDAIRSASSLYNQAKEIVRQRTAALKSLETEIEIIESELTLLRSTLNVCPVCDRPMIPSEVTA